MMIISKKVLCIILLLFISQPPDAHSQNLKADGYKGIWFTLGQFSEYGDKVWELHYNMKEKFVKPIRIK
jgi:hypothetical protein